MVRKIRERQGVKDASPFFRHALVLVGVLVLLAGYTGCGSSEGPSMLCEDQCPYEQDRQCRQDGAAVLICLRDADGCLDWVRRDCPGYSECNPQIEPSMCHCDEGYAGEECSDCAFGYRVNEQGNCVVITTEGTRFHPGHYVKGTYRPSKTISQLLESANRPNFSGTHLVVDWKTIEASRGAYNISMIEEALEILEQRDQYLIIQARERCFGCTSPSAVLPQYIIDEGWAVKPNADRDFWILRLNEPSALQRWILVLKQIARLCNSHPHCEGVKTPETALGGLQNELTIDAYISILKQIASETKSVMPDANFFTGVNFIPQADTTFPALYEYFASIGAGISWPDTFLGPGSPAQQSAVAYRGILPIGASMEGAGDNASPSDLYQSAMKKGANYIDWVPWFHGDPYDFDKAVMLVNELGGAVENNQCPSAIAPCVQ